MAESKKPTGSRYVSMIPEYEYMITYPGFDNIIKMFLNYVRSGIVFYNIGGASAGAQTTFDASIA